MGKKSSHYHWCQCCNNSNSLTCFLSQHVLPNLSLSRLLEEAGFLTIPLPELMTILMIDLSPPECVERERSTPQLQGKGDMDHPTRSESCPAFCFQWWDQRPLQLQRNVLNRWRPAREKMLLQSQHALSCLFTKTEVAEVTPFVWKQRKDTSKSHGFPLVYFWWD